MKRLTIAEFIGIAVLALLTAMAIADIYSHRNIPKNCAWVQVGPHVDGREELKCKP